MAAITWLVVAPIVVVVRPIKDYERGRLRVNRKRPAGRLPAFDDHAAQRLVEYVGDSE